MTDPLVKLIGSWAGELCVGAILLRLGLSVFCSAIIGCERAAKRHAAGLRTFILVSMAGTAAMMMDSALSGGRMPLLSAAVIVGIAIIATNTILYTAKSQIKGLTTSVGLWVCGVLALAFGAGYYTLALAGFLAMLCCLSWLPAIEKYLKDRSNHFELHLELKSKYNLQDFVTTLRRLGLVIDEIESNPAYLNSGLSVYSVSVSISSAELKKYKTHKQIIEALRTLDYVYFIDELQ